MRNTRESRRPVSCGPAAIVGAEPHPVPTQAGRQPRLLPLPGGVGVPAGTRQRVAPGEAEAGTCDLSRSRARRGPGHHVLCVAQENAAPCHRKCGFKDDAPLGV